MREAELRLNFGTCERCVSRRKVKICEFGESGEFNESGEKQIHKIPFLLLPNGSSFGDLGPHGDFFQSLGPH